LSIFKALGLADELKLIFKKPEASPALLAKAILKKTQERVRRPKKSHGATEENWEWGEDKE
jgi:hypothetical protein